MSKSEKHIEQITPELLKAYQEGRLSKEEVYALEKLMLENPLYAEGIEGLNQLANVEFQEDLLDLDKRLERLTDDPGTVNKPFWTVWRGAAAALIIIVTGFYLLKPNQSLVPRNELSKLEESKSSNNEIARDSIDESGNDSLILEDSLNKDLMAEIPDEEEFTLDMNINDSLEKEILEMTALEEMEKEINVLDSIEVVIPMIAFESVPESFTPKPKNTTVFLGDSITQNTKSTNQPLLRSRQSIVSSNSPDLNGRTISGRIVGADDGLPLPQVTILHKGTTNGISTDLEGKFTFNNLPQDATLSIRYLGYITQDISTLGVETLNIQLQPDATSLGEVVVTGVSALDLESPEVYADARPEDGFRNYNKYLKDNLIYPEKALENRIKGKVTLEFMVFSDGSISEPLVLKSLGYGCDEEAIRLIKEGPKWNPKLIGEDKSPESSVVRIKVRFKP